MLYLYAIIDQPGVEFELPRGLEDAAPDVLAFDGLGVVAGPLNGMPYPDTANAHRHMDVLTTLMQQCTVLPTRFGAVFETREDLDRVITDRHDALAADLLRLRGQVEVGLKVIDRRALILKPVHGESVSAAPVPETETDTEKDKGLGLRYITTRHVDNGRRQRRAQANEALAAATSAPFASLTTAHTWRSLPSGAGRPAIAAAFLLPRERLDAFNEALGELRRSDPKLEIVCTGPWPAYSFVNGGGHSFSAGEGENRIAS